MIITASTADKFYLNQLLAFTASLKVNSPDHKIHVYLVNYPDELEERLVDSFDNCVFENWDVEMIDDRGFSLIILRAFLFKDCFEKYGEQVAWVDTDVLVREDLSGFLSIEPNQLKILVRETNYTNKFDAPINAGVFNLGCSRPTYNFICDWYNAIVANPVWGIGQVELWKAYLKHKEEIELIHMPVKFNDLGGRPNMFADDSAIWHCKYKHFNNEKFQKEFKKYLDIANGLFNS